MKTKLLVFFLLTLPISFFVYAKSIVLTYEDLPKLVSTQNGHVQAEKSRLEAANVQTGHLSRSYLPTIRAEGGGEVFQTGNFDQMTQPVGGIEGQINLLRGGKDKLEEAVRKEQVSLSSVALKQSYLRELTQARILYIDFLYYRELISQLSQAQSRGNQNRTLVQKRISAGLTTDVDRLDFEIHQKELQQDGLLLKEDAEHALDELRVILGFSDDTILNIKGSLSHKHDASLTLAQLRPELHPEVLVLKKLGSTAALQNKQAGRWWTPSVDAYASYSLYPFREREYPARGDRDEAVGGVKVSMALFDGLQGSTQAKSLKYQAQAYEQEATQKSQQVQSRFKKLQHELSVRHEMIHLAQRTIGQGQDYLTLSLSDYERGVKNSVDILSASQRVFDQQRRYAELRRDYLVIKSELLAMLGR